jgi:HEAT repeat protein
MMPTLEPQRLTELLGSDPVLGDEALEYFASLGPSCLDALLPVKGDPPPANAQASRRLAKLCRRFGDAAVPTLIQAIEKGSWQTKVCAATCFDQYKFEYGDKTPELLVKLLKHTDFDVVRCALEALGYMGAYTWAYSLIDDDVGSPKRGEYAFGKIGPHALHALMLMVPRTPHSEEIERLLRTIELHFEALEGHLKPSNPAADLRSGCLGFGPAAADPLMRMWLTHRKEVFRRASLESLSVIGLRRTASAVASRVRDLSESRNLRGDGMRYLGDIGGPVAVDVLETLLATPGVNEEFRDALLWGISSLYPEATRSLAESDLQKIVSQEWSQAKLHLVHGLGFRREGEALVRTCLYDIDPMVRGAAALSLARLKRGDALPEVRVALREASDGFERALVLCGLIFAGELWYTQELHRALCELDSKEQGIWRLLIRWRREFVGALATDADPRFALSWSDVLRVELADCQERLAEWQGAYGRGDAKRASKPSPTLLDTRPARDLIFISYSHADDTLCKEFLKMVRPTAQKHGLKIWSDHEIAVSSVWREEIEKALTQTQIAVLLVSPDFLDSSFIQKNELPPLLEAARTQGARIFWVACRHCNVEDTEIGKFQGVNKPSKPLSGLSKTAREMELQRISQELFKLAQRISGS